MKIRFFIVLLILTMSIKGYAYASEDIDDITDNIEFDGIQSVINNELELDNMDFKSIIEGLMMNKRADIKEIPKKVLLFIKNEWHNNIYTLIRLVILGVMSAMFSKIAGVLKSDTVLETGFHITYLVIIISLLAIFTTAVNITKNTLGKILLFMKVLIPVYSVAVAFSDGVDFSLTYYEIAFIIVTICEYVLLKVIIPLNIVHVMIVIVSNLMENNYLSGFSNMIKNTVDWGIKGLLSCTVATNIFQKMFQNGVEGSKYITMDTMRMVPFFGDTLIQAVELVSKSAVVLKNSIGQGGILILLMVCLHPVIVLIIKYYIITGANAYIEIITDERIKVCFETVAEGIMIFAKIIITSFIMFLLTIAIIAL